VKKYSATFFRKVKIVVDNMLKRTYNYFINLKNKTFFGRKNMTEVAKNYTEEMVDAMVADYQANPTPDTVAALATEFNKSTRSIVAKLVREGVYKAQPRAVAAKVAVVRKADLVATINEALGVELETLSKASKADLEVLVAAVSK
jgi:monoamine oxidase